ncbi:hypothetical protein LCGC14_0683820 [marine sediment metagenome]|uniref:AraC family transcriptional regulator n=2 Tax=root TaxID=1 RepID=A0A831R639_9GAMM|nr:AraC family transcriptional regulator [Marinobacter antarcticus]HEA53667.1 AraC family transcriptional regulator [Marinobacter antarcticus]
MDSKHEILQWDESSTFHHVSCDNATLHKRWHYHEEFEFHYFRSFSGTAFIGNYVGKLAPESLFLLAPCLPHCWTGETTESNVKSEDDSPADFLVLFPEEVIVGAYALFPELRTIEKMLEDAQFGIEFEHCPEIAEIGELMLGVKALEGCARLSRFFSILDRLTKCQYRKLSSLNLSHGSDPIVHEMLSRAMDYINEHFKENITLERVSEIANMSSAHFCRIFKKTYGIGFIDYVNSLRIEHACELLNNTSNPISSIGYECGYSNISNFNRNFRKYVGKSPSAFRDDITEIIN